MLCFHIKKKKENLFSFIPKFIFPIHLILGSLVEAYLKEEDKAWANYPKKNKLSSVKGL